MVCHARRRVVCPEPPFYDDYQGPVLLVALRSSDAARYGVARSGFKREGGAPMPALHELPQDCAVALAWVVGGVTHRDVLAALGTPDHGEDITRVACVLAPDVGVFRRPLRLPQTEAA
jgi:hypothetical protein